MERRFQRGAQGSGASAVADAMCRPPLRVRFRHEPTDRVDGYATIDVAPCAAALAIATLLDVTRPTLSTLLIDARRTLGGRSQRMSRHQSAAFERAGLSRSLALDCRTLREMSNRFERRATVVRIDGPIDAGDALALEQAILAGSSPLDADLRTVVALQVHPNGTLWSQWRDTELARSFVARLVARFVVASAGVAIGDDSFSSATGLRLPRGGCVVRPRDVRWGDGSITAAIRTHRGVARRIVLDAVTGQWGSIR